MFNIATVLDIVFVAVIGGIIGLDRTAAGQIMISQPIVAAPFIGWILGDLASGLVIGAALELVWVLDIPVGTFVPADATISAVSATAVSVLAGRRHPSLSLIGLSILLTVAIVPLTMRSDGLVRTWNSRLYDRVWNSSGQGLGTALIKAQATGLTLFFLKSFALYCLFIPAGIAIVGNSEHLPAAVDRALSMFVKLLPLLGIAMIIRRLSMRSMNVYFLAAFLCAALFIHADRVPALAVLTVAAGAGWYGGTLLEKRT